MRMAEQENITLLTRDEAATLLGVKPGTLATWHSQGRYDLPVVMVGRLPRYRLSELRAWLNRRNQQMESQNVTEKLRALQAENKALRGRLVDALAKRLGRNLARVAVGLKFRQGVTR